MARLFVAIELPDWVRARLAALASGLREARRTPPDQLHLTLRFIGEADGAAAEEIAAELDRIRAAPFRLRLSGLGHFGSRGQPRALWAGVARSEALNRLQRRVEAAVVRAGMAPERRNFTPHITLARMRGGSAAMLARHIAAAGTPDGAAFEVAAFTLFSSRLGRDGAAHRRELVFPLDGGAAPPAEEGG